MRPFPDDWRPDPNGIRYALEHGVTDISSEVEKCRDWYLANGKQVADPAAVWRMWVRKAEEFGQHDQTSADNGGGILGALKRRVERRGNVQ